VCERERERVRESYVLCVLRVYACIFAFAHVFVCVRELYYSIYVYFK
jgi:hypothetical protein